MSDSPRHRAGDPAAAASSGATAQADLTAGQADATRADATPADAGPTGEPPTEGSSFTPEASGLVSARGLASATRWMVAGRLVTQGSRFLVSIILARLLSPEAFGVVAVAMTTIVALEIVKDLGTGAALIQRQHVDQRLLSSVFFLNVVAGFVAAGLMAVGAPLIADFFATPDATSVVQAFSLVLAVGGLTQVHHALLRRRMRFGGVAAVEMTAALTTGVVSIVLALLGVGVWSMVWGNLAGTVTGSAVAWVASGWRPSRQVHRADLRAIAGFSLNTAGYNVTTFALENTDKILVGRWLGTAPLGVYTLAQRTISYPLESISKVLMQVLFPAFARAQDDNATLRKGYSRAVGAIAFVTLPVMVGAAVVADPMVHAVLGEKWVGLIPLLWFMAPAGALGALLSAVNTIYSAKGRADWMFRWGLASGVARLAAFAIGLQWDLQGLAIAYLAVMAVEAPVGYAIVLRLIEMPLRAMGRVLAPYFTMTAAMAAGAWLTVRLLGSTGATPWAQLGAAVGVGVLVYGGLALVIRPAALRDVRTLATSRG